MAKAVFSQRQPALPQAARRWSQHQPPWKRPLMRFSLCFVLGFLLGFSPFFHLDGIRPVDPSSFDSGAPFPFRRNTDSSGGDADHQGSRRIPSIPGKSAHRSHPTYNRAFQALYLTRLGQTLRLVRPPLLWIVVEMEKGSAETAELLRTTGVMYRHLVAANNLSDIKDRGVHQRNTALEHIERHHLDGIVYFADDDNIYTIELFEHIREIRRFGTWPVAMLSQSKNKVILEGPVCNGSQVIGWHTNEKSKRLRRFHVDMSGFAFNSTILWDSKRWHRPTAERIRQLDTVKEGFQETTFIEQLVEDESQMEGIPRGCSLIMNWHLHLEAKDLFYPRGWRPLKNLEVVVPIT
ncbi:unnamed protein product [Spirodela intermedia]|uniref:Glycosyltransferases n=1 Tax=Spirodela intermedia TaxID=51605 RepID=A0A7I8IZ80_SPIIN|nr:unnamed protein product [Spirodela intermedia]CAA6663109.1 unnamed protein product [Spirodela intermedia]